MTEDKYKRITKNQYEIWKDNPVTVAYIQCLGWSFDQISEAMGKGAFVDASSSDLTMSQVHAALGHKRGLEMATNPMEMLKIHEMIDLKEDEENE